MRYLILIAAALLLTACECWDGRKVERYYTTEESRDCDHECAVATAKGGGGHYTAEQSYFRCLGTCPGVTRVHRCKGDPAPAFQADGGPGDAGQNDAGQEDAGQ